MNIQTFASSNITDTRKAMKTHRRKTDWLPVSFQILGSGATLARVMDGDGRHILSVVGPSAMVLNELAALGILHSGGNGVSNHGLQGDGRRVGVEHGTSTG